MGNRPLRALDEHPRGLDWEKPSRPSRRTGDIALVQRALGAPHREHPGLREGRHGSRAEGYPGHVLILDPPPRHTVANLVPAP